jgi:hypothetical protein
MIGGPLEQVAQVVAVGVQGPAAVASQEGHCRQLSFIETVGLERSGDRLG